MNYQEFRKASYRHLYTCKCLLKNIEKEECKKHKQDIIKNTFYLRGYILECALKFIFFNSFRLKGDVYEYQDENWKTHDLKQLENILNRKGVQFSADIPILGSKSKINKKIIELFKKRHNEDAKMQIRYTYYDKTLTIEILDEYLQTIEEIHTKLIKTYSYNGSLNFLISP